MRNKPTTGKNNCLHSGDVRQNIDVDTKQQQDSIPFLERDTNTHKQVVQSRVQRCRRYWRRKFALKEKLFGCHRSSIKGHVDLIPC